MNIGFQLSQPEIAERKITGPWSRASYYGVLAHTLEKITIDSSSAEGVGGDYGVGLKPEDLDQGQATFTF